MATLKGQNFRVGTVSGSKFQVFGMAVSGTVTLNTQTDDASTKDDTGMASKPTVTSKSAQIQVESLQVTDVAAMLTTIKSMQPMTLLWDEVSTANNQQLAAASFARECQVYLNDATFNFNDRENSTKSLQFISTGPIKAVGIDYQTQVLSTGTYTKGQHVRLYLSSDNTAAPSSVIAAAKQLSLHVSVSMESATTKDTEGDWDVQEPTSIAFDITSNALVRSNDRITSTVGGADLSDIETIYEAGAPVKFQIANVSGANQRTKGTVIVSGSVIVSQLQIAMPNKQNATFTTNLTGYGDYVVGA